MKVRETAMDADTMVIIGDTGWQEAFTDNIGHLFRSCQKEFGRCIGKLYRDVAVAFYPPVARCIGWAFQKRVKYEDVNDTYLSEIWVEYRKESKQ